MFRTFIQFLGILLTLGSSVLLLKGNIGLGVETIREAAAAKFGINPTVVWSLAAQEANTWVGLALLILGIALQVGNAAWPIRIMDFGVSPKGVFLAIGVAGLLMAGAWCVAERCTAKTVAEVRANVEAEGEETRDEIWVKP